MFGFFKRLSRFRSTISTIPVSSQETQAGESFTSLLAPDLCTNTDAFLTVYRDGIRRSKESERIPALTRFIVVSIHVHKCQQRLSEHEFASVVVIDKTTNEKYNFCVERNTSDIQVRLSHRTRS